MTRPQSRISKINSLKQRISNNRSRHSLVNPLHRDLVRLVAQQLRYEMRTTASLESRPVIRGSR
jgi:hypothetical protein